MENKRVILLVEDDNSFRQSLRKLLEKEGFEVLETASGEEALETLGDSKKIDLVLLDLYLGGITGLEVLERIPERKRPPVIMLTAFGDWGLYSDAINRGAADCLPKPVKKQDLLRVISAAMEPQRLR